MSGPRGNVLTLTHVQTWTHPHLCSFVRGFNDVPLHSSPNSVPLWLAWWPLPYASVFSHATWLSAQMNKFVLVWGKGVKTNRSQKCTLIVNNQQTHAGKGLMSWDQGGLFKSPALGVYNSRGLLLKSLWSCALLVQTVGFKVKYRLVTKWHWS